MKRKVDETNVIIQAPEASPLLNGDTVNTIAMYLPYAKGLSFFRQTSKHYNLLIEDSKAGKQARTASKLEEVLAMRIKLATPFDRGSETYPGITEIFSSIIGAASIFVLSSTFNDSPVTSILAGAVSGYIANCLLVNFDCTKESDRLDKLKLIFLFIFCTIPTKFISTIIAKLCGPDISNTLMGFASELSTSNCSTPLYEHLSELGIEYTPSNITAHMFKSGIPISDTSSYLFALVTIILCLDIQFDNKGLEKDIRDEVSSLRKPLYKPFS